MSKKVAYEKTYDVYCGYGDRHKIELTGRCKRVTENGYAREYAEVQRRVFGIPIGKRWVAKDYIELHDEPIVEYYECKDLKSE